MPITPSNAFKGRQYPGEVIQLAVGWYLRYPLAVAPFVGISLKDLLRLLYRRRRPVRFGVSKDLSALGIPPSFFIAPSHSIGMPAKAVSISRANNCWELVVEDQWTERLSFDDNWRFLGHSVVGTGGK